jgi:hypothetical protein
LTKGSGFSGILRYVLDVKPGGGRGSKRAEVLEMSAADPGQCYEHFMKRFALCVAMKPNIKKPVWHCSLSLPKGEKLGPGRWEEVVESFLGRMGFGANHPRAVVRHGDKEHDHVHIVCCRIGMDGQLWGDSNDVFRAIKATQELEKAFRLRLTVGYGEKAERKNAKFSERKMEDRTGEAAPRVRLQETIDQILEVGPTAVEFCEYLEASGVEVRASLAGADGLNGFSFSVDGVAFKGSGLGKAYSWGGLQKRGLVYDPGRDFEGLARFAAGTEKLAPGAGAAESPGPDSKGRLKGLIDESALGGPTAAEFCERLEAAGVVPKANLASTGRLNGFSFEMGGETVAGSSLGKAYSWGGLQKRGVGYDPDRDFDGLRRFSSLAEEPAEPAGPPESAASAAEGPKAGLQRLISLAAEGGPSAAEFCRRLEAAGVGVKANLASTGRLNGFSFTFGGETHTGSSLGKPFGWAGLRAGGVSYDPDRDFGGLRRFSSLAAAKEAGVPGPAEAAPKARLKSAISEAVSGRPSAAEFGARLGAMGVGAKANRDAAGRLSGFTFTIDGVDFNGASLGGDCSLAGLRERGLSNETTGGTNGPRKPSDGTAGGRDEARAAGSAAKPTFGRAERKGGAADGGTDAPEAGHDAFFAGAGDAPPFGRGHEGAGGPDPSGDGGAAEDERGTFGFGRSRAKRDEPGGGAPDGSDGEREDAGAGEDPDPDRDRRRGRRRRAIRFATLDFIRRLSLSKPRRAGGTSEAEKARLRRLRERSFSLGREGDEKWFGLAGAGGREADPEGLSIWSECFDLQRMDNGWVCFYDYGAEEPLLTVTPDEVICRGENEAELGLWVAMNEYGGAPIKVVGSDRFREAVYAAAQKMYEEYGIAPEIEGMARPSRKARPGAAQTAREESGAEPETETEAQGDWGRGPRMF